MHGSSVIVSKDTDFTMILKLAEYMRRQKFIYVIRNHVVELDNLVYNLVRYGIDQNTLSSAYVLAGCDFTGGTFGVRHEHYLKAAIGTNKFLKSSTAMYCPRFSKTRLY